MSRGDPRRLPGVRGAQNTSADTFRYKQDSAGRSTELIDTGTRTGTLYERMAKAGAESASLGPSPLALAGGEYGARMRQQREAQMAGSKPVVAPEVPLLATPKEGRMDSVEWYMRSVEFRESHPELSPFGQPAGARPKTLPEAEAFPMPDLPTLEKS